MQGSYCHMWLERWNVLIATGLATSVTSDFLNDDVTVSQFSTIDGFRDLPQPWEEKDQENIENQNLLKLSLQGPAAQPKTKMTMLLWKQEYRNTRKKKKNFKEGEEKCTLFISNASEVSGSVHFTFESETSLAQAMLQKIMNNNIIYVSLKRSA